MGMVHWVAWILVIVGALNWGLVGVFQFNLVNWILHSVPVVERLVYILVGVSAVAMFCGKGCKLPGSSS
ncbi:DUF378 domain-containing protein [Candidatus Uhrbacteria bacterium]|nr:DUF378 domain-containing protein [Candidatus Uhrbacteria bacterium]